MKNYNLNTLTSIGVHYQRQSVFSILSHCSDTYQRAQNHKTLGPSTSHRLSTIATITLGLLVVLLGGLFFSHSVYAGTSISIASGSSGNNNVISFGNVKPSSSGSVVTASDELTITTDCAAGSNVYISAVDGSSYGTNLINNAAASNNEISTLSGTTIGTTATTLSNNTWGFNTDNSATSSGANNGNGVYYGLPAYANATDHAIYSGTNTTVPIYYGAKVTNSLVPGKYIGQVLYTATVNNSCLDYTLKFNTNGATSSTLVDQTHNVNDLIDLSTISSTSVISKTGYHLTGWKDQDNNEYGITGPVDVNPADTSPVTLTAQWAPNTYTIKYNANAVRDCSDTVHPTTTAGCKMADGKVWILGNNNNSITWDNMFTGSGNNATVNSGICPIGYSAPKVADYDDLVMAYGGSPTSDNGYMETTGVLFKMLGLSTYGQSFWSSTGSYSGSAYSLDVTSSRSISRSSGYKSNHNRVLCYKPDPASGSTADQTNQAYNSNITLRANGYTLRGYDFLGWSLNPSAATASYSANTAYDVSTLATAANIQDTDGGTITLYAIWTIVYMQDFSCSNLSSGQTKDLTDRRDNSVYTVKKFSSDNDSCWMIQNLRLGYDKAYTLTSTYTNITDNGSYYLPQAGYQASLDGTNVATVSFSSSSDSQARVQYATTSDLLAKNSSLANAQDTGYYNFYAATLGKSYYGLNGNVSGYVERDICPKGWQLPVNDSSNHRSWYYFYNTLNGGQHANLMSASGASLLYSGSYLNSSLNEVGSYGYWWSSTVYNTNSSYSLRVYSNGNVVPQRNNNKYYGFAVRCVATQ